MKERHREKRGVTGKETYLEQNNSATLRATRESFFSKKENQIARKQFSIFPFFLDDLFNSLKRSDVAGIRHVPIII